MSDLKHQIKTLSSPKDAALCCEAFGSALGADRCFLYLRDPNTDSGQVVATWMRGNAVLDLPAHDYYRWQAEDRFLHESDPMFTTALAGAPATFVDDIFDADGAVNPEFEQEFNHRSLIHLNLNAGGALWGILQPAMNTAVRAWSAADSQLCEIARAHLTPLARRAVEIGPWTSDTPPDAAVIIGQTAG